MQPSARAKCQFIQEFLLSKALPKPGLLVTSRPYVECSITPVDKAITDGKAEADT